MKRPELHVFLGAGGVGKTTLSAGFALALARQGRRVGLISIDPARRLKGALGVEELKESGTEIQTGQSVGSLHAAVFNVSECFERWIENEGMNPERRNRLFENKLFRAVVEKFATSTDTFAAVRVVEWSEQQEFDDIVVDTAPGIHAVDFLSKPDKLLAFLDGKLVEWLKWFVGVDPDKRSLLHRVVKSGARKILDGLAQIGGKLFLINFGEFLVLLDDVFATMFRRLEGVVKWLRSEKSHFYLVTAVREDAVFVARRLRSELEAVGVSPRMCVVNKSFPESLSVDEGFRQLLDAHSARIKAQQQSSHGQQALVHPPEPFLNYLASYGKLQARVLKEMKSTAACLVQIPLASELDGTESIRLEDLMKLGNYICMALPKI